MIGFVGSTGAADVRLEQACAQHSAQCPFDGDDFLSVWLASAVVVSPPDGAALTASGARAASSAVTSIALATDVPASDMTQANASAAQRRPHSRTSVDRVMLTGSI